MISLYDSKCVMCLFKVNMKITLGFLPQNREVDLVLGSVNMLRWAYPNDTWVMFGVWRRWEIEMEIQGAIA